MRRPRYRLVALLLTVVLAASACSQPIEIIGEGDVVSQSGTRTCTFEDHQAGAAACTQNVVTGALDETYRAEPRPGWHFHRWASYCTGATDNTCSFDIPANVVELALGQTVPPLVAVFRPDVVTGFDSLATSSGRSPKMPASPTTRSRSSSRAVRAARPRRCGTTR